MLARLSGQLGAVAALHQAAPAAFVAGLQHLGSGRAWLTSSAPASAAASAAPDGDKHVIDEKSDSIVGAYTPITKRLWLQRYRWTDDRLASARERDPAAAATLRKPPQPLSVRYPFSSDPVVREHYRNPWGEARIGRILEDLDSLAGYVGFEHWWVPAATSTQRARTVPPSAGWLTATFQPRSCSSPSAHPLPPRRPPRPPRSDDGDPATRPPLLVTASVEAIQLRGSSISLDEDMEASGLCRG